MYKIVNKEIIQCVRNSKYFDEEFYKKNFNIDWNSIDPVLHYCLIGDEYFVNPSKEFDLNKYYMAYPDVYTSRINALYHYEKHGRLELRKKWKIKEEFDYDLYTNK